VALVQNHPQNEDVGSGPVDESLLSWLRFKVQELVAAAHCETLAALRSLVSRSRI